MSNDAKFHEVFSSISHSHIQNIPDTTEEEEEKEEITDQPSTTVPVESVIGENPTDPTAGTAKIKPSFLGINMLDILNILKIS